MLVLLFWLTFIPCFLFVAFVDDFADGWRRRYIARVEAENRAREELRERLLAVKHLHERLLGERPYTPRKKAVGKVSVLP